MRPFASVLLGLSLAGCAASSTSDATTGDEAALTATTARPTDITVTTDRANRLTASILVDPPTGAGWAAPALLVRYEDTTHAYHGANALVADVTVHFSAPAHDTHGTVSVRLDNSGGYLAPYFLDGADIQHVEGIDIAVGDGSAWDASDPHHEHAYHLGAIRPDVDDAASISPADHVAVRGFQRSAKLDAALSLAIDLDAVAFPREEVPGYDGQGQAFALVPSGTAWTRTPLAGTSGHFTATVPSPDRAAIAASGVAFGLTTNRGTIWLQDPHGNLKP